MRIQPSRAKAGKREGESRRIARPAATPYDQPEVHSEMALCVSATPGTRCPPRPMLALELDAVLATAEDRIWTPAGVSASIDLRFDQLFTMEARYGQN